MWSSHLVQYPRLHIQLKIIMCMCGVTESQDGIVGIVIELWAGPFGV